MASKRKFGTKRVLELLDSHDSDFEKEFSDSESEEELIAARQSRSGRVLMKTVKVMLEILEKKSSVQSQERKSEKKSLFMSMCGVLPKT